MIGAAQAGRIVAATVLLAAPLASSADESVPDQRPPSVIIERPTERAIVVPMPQANVSAPIEPVLIEGAAGDDVEMFAVTLHIIDTIGRTSVVMATCDGCGSKVARWNFRATLPPGSYTVQARGHDTAGNTGFSQNRQFYVL